MVYHIDWFAYIEESSQKGYRLLALEHLPSAWQDLRFLCNFIAMTHVSDEDVGQQDSLLWTELNAMETK